MSTCPHCSTRLRGLGTYCSACRKYTDEGRTELAFTFPLPPNLANSRMHHMAKHRAKKAYWKKLDALQQAGKMPRPPREPWTRAEASAHFHLWNRMDEGNALNRLKWVEDWLVTRGYLVDDRAKNLHWTAIPEQTIDRKDQRVEIELRVA